MVLNDSVIEKLPVIYIQSDWNIILKEVGRQVWVSCKYKDEPSVQGTIAVTNVTSFGVKVTATDGFVVDFVSPECLHIRYSNSSHSTFFIAPTNTYSHIHDKSVVSLSVTTRGVAVSSGSDNKLKIWSTSEGVVQTVLNGHVGNVYKCRFFPSEKVVLTCGADMQIKIWSANTGICPVTLVGHSMAVTDVAIVDRGKNIVSVSKDGVAKLWNCGDASCLVDIIKVNSEINCCSIYHLGPSSLHLGTPADPISSKEISTDGKVLLLGCEDGAVYGVALKSRKQLFVFSHDTAVNSVTFISMDFFVVGTQSGAIYLYDVNNLLSPFKIWFESNSPVLRLLEYKEKGFFTARADGSVVFRLINNNTKHLSLTGPDFDPVYDMSTDGRYLFTCCRDTGVRKYPVDRILQSSGYV